MDDADLQRELAELEALANAMLKRIAKLRAGPKPAVVDREPPPEAYASVLERRRKRATRALKKRLQKKSDGE